MISDKDIQRMMSRVSRESNGCWEWTGPMNAGGYGLMILNGKSRYCHRISWCHHNNVDIESIETKDIVRHKCDNRSCVNPEHLEMGSSADNAQDRESRGRGRAKLSLDDVSEIRIMYSRGIPLKDISSRFNISTPYASEVSTSKRLFKRCSVPPQKKRNNSKRVCKDKINSMKKDLASGIKKCEIAYKYGVSCSYVSLLDQGKVGRLDKVIDYNDKCMSRIKSKIDIDKDGCWIWNGSKVIDRDRYPTRESQNWFTGFHGAFETILT